MSYGGQWLGSYNGQWLGGEVLEQEQPSSGGVWLVRQQVLRKQRDQNARANSQLEEATPTINVDDIKASVNKQLDAISVIQSSRAIVQRNNSQIIAYAFHKRRYS